MTPATLPMYTTEPSHDSSSTVMGPFGKGVSSDCKIVRAGESHPSAHPTDTVAKLAISHENGMDEYYCEVI